MFKKLACFTSWLVVLALSLVFCLILGLWQEWSTPMILLLWLLMLGLAILLWGAIYAVTRLINGKKRLRWLEKFRLSRREYVLLSHWKTGATIVKRAQRSRQPLPWFLLVGDRCGKSTLLASTQLPRFYGESEEVVASPTRTLRWWFFRDLSLLDLSSNFINGNQVFRQGWQKIVRWSRRMPTPAGIIIALPVTDLLNDDLSAIHASIRRQRALIEPLVHRYTDRVPLSVVITQCDHLAGFSLWQAQLSAAQRHQPLGYCWPTPPHIDGQDENTLAPLFGALKTGFEQVRFSMARPDSLSPQEYATLLDFPEQFARLEPALRYALAALCEPNAYFSPTVLRGVWFTATETQAENRARRLSHFTDDLLSGQLSALRRQGSTLRWYQRPRGKRICYSGLLIGTLWLLLSAVLSGGRLSLHPSTASPDELATFVADDELRSPFSLRYLPFLPLLEQRRQQAEAELTRTPFTPRSVNEVMPAWREQVLTAAPAAQRTQLLQLAQAILSWQQMRDGASLHALQQRTPVIQSLQPLHLPDTLSPLAALALQRQYLLRPEGERWLLAARQQLDGLVNQLPATDWLTADSEALSPRQAQEFWPSLPPGIALSGIWTRDGERTVMVWIAEIEQALGHPLPVLQNVRERWPALRQAAWRQYLVNVTSSLTPQPAMLAHNQLIALSQNRSPVMRFSAGVVKELGEIPDPQAESWLSTLRQLQHLSAAATLLNRTSQVNNRLRQSLTAWLKGASAAQGGTASQATLLWRQWQKARDTAVSDAIVRTSSSAALTRGLFAATEQNGAANPLATLLPALAALQEHLSSGNGDPDVAVVWQLYQNDANLLIGNALAHSACWLNTQWKNSVLWPLQKDAQQRSYDQQQTLSQQMVGDFLRGPAKALLVASDNGPAPASYGGITLPLSADFLHLARQSFSPEMMQDVPRRASSREGDRRAELQAKASTLTQRIAALEKKSWKATVASQPATVPGGAPVIPVGTRLTLNCQSGDQQLDSMNFAEKAHFLWQPGQCSGVTLDVKFPDFTARYALDGDDAWPWFIESMATGEMLIERQEFGDKAGLLAKLGISNILVRFAITDTQGLADAWKQWRSATDQLADLNDQIASLDDSLQRQQDAAQQASPLSALPSQIAQCQ